MLISTSRSFVLDQHRTSMRLTSAEWKAIAEICQKEEIKRKKLFETINSHYNINLNFTLAVKLFTLVYYYQSYIQKTLPKHQQSGLTPLMEALKSIL